MFIFSRNTQIIAEKVSVAVQNAIQILKRDCDKSFMASDCPINKIILQCAKECLEKEKVLEEAKAQEGALCDEQFLLKVTEKQISITAKDDLGFIYGLLYISEKYLGIKPFWFWMDQRITQTECVKIAPLIYISPRPVVRFRGWFFNDEVLMLKWKYNENGVDGWKMAFEALLRCGGNMAVPGTDKMSRKNRKLASDMGLWITHHHAEPLGAEMFARAYPGMEANFAEHPELFYKLWEDAVKEQKDYKTVWNLCFRGQGDTPFWSSDTTGAYDTPGKRGRLISELIRKQCDIVKRYVENPVFCTNLYGEIMELYKEGYIELDDEVIKVRADNGFGRMVTRRRDNHSVRVSSMPDKEDKGAQGIYYHVSFYDLQAAAHITMLPNSISFVDKELTEVLENGGEDFWLINCSNVRPHAYHLDAIRKKWFGRKMDDATQSEEFVADYFGKDMRIAQCYQKYPEAMLSYGEHEDEHIGEQFYTESLRIIAHQLLISNKESVKALQWITGECDLSSQVKVICGLCEEGLGRLTKYYEYSKELHDKLLQEQNSATPDGQEAKNYLYLYDATIFLQVQLHYYCAQGVVLFGKAFLAYEEKRFQEAFVLLGNSVELFEKADLLMRTAEYGVWENFYLNDCLADIKHTAYMIRKVMGIVRELGDNIRHDKWYREFCYKEEDREVFLLLVLDNHMTDWELYEVMKSKMMH
ncbi:MAG: glycosyl hydrolase 115 family protein [Lachnospiraceae bacterium]|nr:glycosyl hydrolase 115 family protein [Lachnospiraceae bacterium]